VQDELEVSERRACVVVEQPRSSQRYERKQPEKDRVVLRRLVELSGQHPRYGYRRITQLLRREGYAINRKRVLRLWRQEGLKVPQRLKKKRRLGSSANACFRRRAQRRNQVWSYDFVMDQTQDGRRLKWLVIVDEYTRECLRLEVERRMNAAYVLGVLQGLIAERGRPEFIRSDNGPEFIALAVRKFLEGHGGETAYIAPGAPWENAYSETFNSRMGDELMKREEFTSLTEAQVLGKRYRREYNEDRPHSALGYKTPKEFAAESKDWESRDLGLQLRSNGFAPTAPIVSSPVELVSATDAESDGAAGLGGSLGFTKLS